MFSEKSIMSRWSQVPDSPSASLERRVNRNKKSYSTNVYSRFFFHHSFKLFNTRIRFFPSQIPLFVVDKIPDPHQRIYVFLTQKSDKFSKVRSGALIPDPESWIRIFSIPDPDPGSRGQKSTGSRIRIRDLGLQSFLRDPDPGFSLDAAQRPDLFSRYQKLKYRNSFLSGGTKNLCFCVSSQTSWKHSTFQ